MADRRLQVFHAVVKHGSFTRAAEALFMSQSSVTFQIRQLEDEYRVRLLDRGPGPAVPTPAGEVVFEYAVRILALFDELDARMADLGDLMRGTLAVGASTAVAGTLMPALLGEFSDHFPQLHVRLEVANSAELARRVASRALQAAVVDAATEAAGVIATACGSDEVVVMVAPDHPLAKSSKVRAKALGDYELVAREPGSGTRAAVDAWFRSAGFEPGALKVQMELGSHEALLNMAAAGLGCAFASRRSAAAWIDAGRLRALRLEPPLQRGFHILVAEERFRPRAVVEFVAAATRHLKENA